MNITVARKELIRLVAHCSTVADRKSAMPVLATALLSAEGRTLSVAATDLFLSVTGRAEAEVDKPGEVAVPAKDLLERLKAMPEGPITITAKKDVVTVSADGANRKFTLYGIPADDFPKVSSPSGLPAVLLYGSAFSALITRTNFSISEDTSRPHVNSALLEWTPGTVRMVSTDGHRLSKVELPQPGLEGSGSMMLPLKAVYELKKLAAEAAAELVTIETSDTEAFFSALGVTLAVKLVDATFPPYKQVIPASTKHRFTAPRAALAEALRAVSLATSDRTRGVTLEIAPSSLRLAGESPESGVGTDSISIDYDGQDASVGINARYLLDVLCSCDSENVTFGMSGELDPVLVQPEPGYEAVIMPMRV